ncbi:UDP-glucuronosyl/UDP-glucosyltransferase [Parasponia andersonii]|uniref:UDP-glucuronosyl/UDP-glucosyltransferase n=1 Tax=Parasponia andersonii TaxID=3476 RepID=A0A2P5BG05_PARAD|nr:UDP-glucuronosyl/UDP-glucosyltransferase [Parasponia andersonii]
MEGDYIDYLKGEYGPDRVWAVGPLKLLEDEGSGSGSSSTPARHDVMTWLDQRRDGSVVFVCFGSWVSLTENTVNVIAAGLERSGVNFVWRVGDNDVVPSDFEERVGCRGYVIKGWAPQMQILRHRALASFLTHCGWNSAVEATSVGAPMLTWPITGDQFITAKLLVDHLGVAFRAGEGNRVVPEPDKLAQILRESLDNTRPEIVRVKKLSDAAFVAIKGGSSNGDLDDLATRLVELKK